MQSPAILEYEPPILLGFSWSEIIMLFPPTSSFWLFILAFIVWAMDFMFQEAVMFGVVTYLISETSTMLLLAFLYKKARKTKYDGWHLHYIATHLNYLGVFKIIHHVGRWRC